MGSAVRRRIAFIVDTGQSDKPAFDFRDCRGSTINGIAVGQGNCRNAVRVHMRQLLSGYGVVFRSGKFFIFLLIALEGIVSSWKNNFKIGFKIFVFDFLVVLNFFSFSGKFQQHRPRWRRERLRRIQRLFAFHKRVIDNCSSLHGSATRIDFRNIDRFRQKTKFERTFFHDFIFEKFTDWVLFIDRLCAKVSFIRLECFCA